MNTTKKALRFAGLIRVSTEAQEQKGESLHTQKRDVRRDSELLEGAVVDWYGGQEHATPGWERKEMDRLLTDATKGKFDAVMMNNSDRWSRDNVKSAQGLDILQVNRIRFFVGTTEYDLSNPEHRLFLEMSATIGKFAARNSAKKSLLNKIARSKRGMPTVGKVPFGRTFDKDAPAAPREGERHLQGWGIIPEKKALIEDIARRLIDGKGKVSLNQLCREYGLSHSNTCKVLHAQCGDIWQQEFKSAEFNIHEVVATPVPRLLPAETIKEVLARLKGNRTHRRAGGRPKHEYLLSGCIYCAACGSALTGEMDKGKRFYRHHKNAKAQYCTVRPRPQVPADAIEQQVVSELFDTFGNSAALERAIKAAVPDCDKKTKERDRLSAEQKKIDQGRERLLSLVAKEAVTEKQAEKQLGQLKEREAELTEQLEKIDAELAEVPDAATIRLYVEQNDRGSRTDIFVHDDSGNIHAGGNSVASYLVMSRLEKRALIESVFGTPLPGAPAGIYVTRTDGRFAYEMRGRFVRHGMLSATRPAATNPRGTGTSSSATCPPSPSPTPISTTGACR